MLALLAGLAVPSPGQPVPDPGGLLPQVAELRLAALIYESVPLLDSGIVASTTYSYQRD